MPNEGKGASTYISGEALKHRLGSDRIIVLAPDGMRTVTDELILVEQVQDDSSIHSTTEAVA